MMSMSSLLPLVVPVTLLLLLLTSPVVVATATHTATNVFDFNVVTTNTSSEAGTTCSSQTATALISRLNQFFNIDPSYTSTMFVEGTGAPLPPSSSCSTRIYISSDFGDIGGIGELKVVSKATQLNGCCVSNSLWAISDLLQSSSAWDLQMVTIGILPLLHVSNITEVPTGSSDFPAANVVAECLAADSVSYCDSSSLVTSSFAPSGGGSTGTVAGDTPATTFDATGFWGTRCCVDFFVDPSVPTSLPSNLGIEGSMVRRKGTTQFNTSTPLHLCSTGDELTLSSLSEFTFTEPIPAPATSSVGSAPSVYNMASAMSLFLHSWTTTSSSSSSATAEDSSDMTNFNCAKHYAAFGQYALLHIGSLERSTNASLYTPEQGLTCAALLNTTRLLESTTPTPGNLISVSPFTYTLNFWSGTSTIDLFLSRFQDALNSALIKARLTNATSEKNITYLEPVTVRPLWIEPSSDSASGRASSIVVGLDYQYGPSESAILPWDQRESELPIFERDIFHHCIWQQGMAKRTAAPTSAPPPPPGRTPRDFPLMWMGTGMTGALSIFMIFVVRRRPMERQDPLGMRYDKSLLADAMNAAESNYRFKEQSEGQAATTTNKSSRRRANSREDVVAGLDRRTPASEMASVQVDPPTNGEPTSAGAATGGTKYYSEEYAKDLPAGMAGGGALVLHNKSVPSYRQAMFDRKYEGPKPETSVGMGGKGKKVEQVAFDKDDSGNPVAAVIGDVASAAASSTTTSHQHLAKANKQQQQRPSSPEHEGKALFAETATSTVIRTGGGGEKVDETVLDDVFGGGGKRAKKTIKKAETHGSDAQDEEDPFGW